MVQLASFRFDYSIRWFDNGLMKRLKGESNHSSLLRRFIKPFFSQNVIKEDLVRVFSKFHRSGVINQSTNATFMALVPKKNQTEKISDFRPINLTTSLYKVIAKILLGRLRGVLHETIHVTQGAFKRNDKKTQESMRQEGF